MSRTNPHLWSAVLRLGLGLMAVLIVTSDAMAMPPAIDLTTIMRLALSGSPAVRKAERDLEAAEQAFADAQADLLCWRATLTTGKPWIVKQQPEESVSANLESTIELARSTRSGQTWSLTLEPVSVRREDAKTSSSLGSLTLGWSTRALGSLPLAAQQMRDRERQVKLRTAALDLARESAVVTVAKAFLDSWKARLDLWAAQEQWQAQQLAVERTQAFARVGRASQQEVAVAEANLALAHADVKTQALQLEVAIRDVARAAGIAVSEIAGASWNEPSWKPSNAGTLEQWLGKALTRPEVLQAELAILAAQDALEEARAAHIYDIKPLVSLDTSSKLLSVGADITSPKEPQGVSFAASLRLRADRNWTVSTQFSSTLGGAKQANKTALDVRNAKADVADAELAWEQAKEDATERLRALWHEIETKALQAELQAALLARERLNLDVVEAQVQIGAATPVDLAEAQAAYAKAEAGARKSLFDQQLAYIKLHAAAGDGNVLDALEEELHGQA